MKRLRELVIEPIDDTHYRAILDGVDISSSCTAITIALNALDVPIVTLVMRLRTVVKVNAEIEIEERDGNESIK